MTRTDTTGRTTTTPATASSWVVACADCRLSGGPFHAGEARMLAGEHDRLHHGGRATAKVTDRHRCESCRSHPAVTTWTPTDASMTADSRPVPFTLCQQCAPVGTDTTTTTGLATGWAGDR
jgi:hypothetical protein